MAIYKREQGKYARGVVATLLLGLTLLGVVEFYDMYTGHGKPVRSFIYPAIILLGGCAGVYFLTNRAKVADHLIEAEVELKKVVWPKQPEILRATGIVLATVLVMALVLFGLDRVFYHVLMRWLFGLGSSGG